MVSDAEKKGTREAAPLVLFKRVQRGARSFLLNLINLFSTINKIAQIVLE